MEAPIAESARMGPARSKDPAAASSSTRLEPPLVESGTMGSRAPAGGLGLDGAPQGSYHRGGYQFREWGEHKNDGPFDKSAAGRPPSFLQWSQPSNMWQGSHERMQSRIQVLSSHEPPPPYPPTPSSPIFAPLFLLRR